MGVDVSFNFKGYPEACYVGQVGKSLNLDRDHAINLGLPGVMSKDMLELVKTGTMAEMNTLSGCQYNYPEFVDYIKSADVISTGLGYGDNARAALITRGIAELARLGVAMGCNVHTFAGLAGIGDLIVTATSMHSRNNRAGILIGKGETPEQAVKEVGMVVEGMNALPAALELAAKYQVEMPIVQTVNAVVNKGMSAAEAVRSLMDRDPKNELPQSYEK